MAVALLTGRILWIPLHLSSLLSGHGNEMGFVHFLHAWRSCPTGLLSRFFRPYWGTFFCYGCYLKY